MSFHRLAMLLSLVSAACSGQSTTQSSPAARDAATAAKAEPAPELASDQSEDLYQIVSIARECARQKPGGLVGLSGTTLVLDRYFLIEPAEGAWRVTFTEQSPSAPPYGRSFQVDAANGLCDGAEVAAPAPKPRRSDARAVLAKARSCAQTAPLDGHGVCGTPLLLDKPTIHHSSDTWWVVSFPETSPNCLPRGQDLVVSADASKCSPAPMD